MAILRVRDDKGNIIDIPAIKGDTGPQGPQGVQGEKGEKGDKGADGITPVVDQTYQPRSENAQSGMAVAQAIADTCVGKKTELNGEIFNDYENNKAYANLSSASGRSTTAGYRGFRIKEVRYYKNTGYGDIPSHVALIVVDDKDLEVKARDVYTVGTKIQFDAVQHHYNKFVNYDENKQLDEEGNSIIPVCHSPYNIDSIIEEDLSLDSDPNENWIWVFGKDYGEPITAQYAAAAFGRQNVAAGTCSFVAGRDNKACNYGAAFGRNNMAGYAGFASGYGVSAEGHYSFAANFQTKALGDISTAFGFASKASGKHSFVSGCRTTANMDFQTVVGKNNDTNSKALFVVGNGEITADEVAGKASNAFEVFEDGSAKVQTQGTTALSVATKGYVDRQIGNIESVLDSIITIQESLIGGATE